MKFSNNSILICKKILLFFLFTSVSFGQQITVRDSETNEVLSDVAVFNESRDKSIIVVIEEVADLWALERASVHKGLYHVLGGTLSAIDGVSPNDIGISELVERAQKDETKEIILAMNATIDGQTTAYYITDQLAKSEVKVSRLARGVPVGGELDYMDDGTLLEAIESRQPF